MRAIVLGCNGYLGKHLSSFLEEHGCSVLGCDIQAEPSVSVTKYAVLNLLEKKQVDSLETNVDFIFNFAALTGTERAYESYEQYIDVNEKGLMHVLDRMRRTTSKAKIIFPSTRLVYKGLKNTPLNEESVKEFKTVYSLNKWFGEQIIQQYSRYYGLEYNIFRICVPYGNRFSDQYSYGTVGIFLKRAKSKQNIVLFGKGEQKRTFTHVEDICRQIYDVIVHTSTKNQIYNIAGETFSLKEIAQIIADRYHVEIEYKEWLAMDEKLESGDTIFDAVRINNVVTHPLKNTFDGWLAAQMNKKTE